MVYQIIIDMKYGKKSYKVQQIEIDFLKGSQTGLKTQGMRTQTKDIIDIIKRKQRFGFSASDWHKNQYQSTNICQLLSQCNSNVVRLKRQTLSGNQFKQKYEKLQIPLVIEGLGQAWKKEKWTFQQLYTNFKDVNFSVGEDDDGLKLKMRLDQFLDYMIHNKDDSPLYLFENQLNEGDKSKLLHNYQVQQFFKEDILSVLGEKRPWFRWFLIGPQRSGSCLHTDPFNTSAWNTLLVGHKRWVCFPPHIPKQIVLGFQFRNSKTDIQAIDYFVNILPRIIEKEGRQNLQIIQFIQKCNDTVFVPGGWWHAVLNLDNTVAITQNYMNTNNFQRVYNSLRSQSELFPLFLDRLHQNQDYLRRSIKINQKFIEQNAASVSLSESNNQKLKNGKYQEKSLKDFEDQDFNVRQYDIPKSTDKIVTSKSMEKFNQKILNKSSSQSLLSNY